MKYKTKDEIKVELRALYGGDFSPKTLNDWAYVIHDNAKKHGSWEEERSVAEIIALCHSELSEALEEFRNKRPMFYVVGEKPEGIATEMIDTVIRILDFLGKEGIDIDEILARKHLYNVSRPYKHGGKKI